MFFALYSKEKRGYHNQKENYIFYRTKTNNST